jgi:hypothetical protein
MSLKEMWLNLLLGKVVNEDLIPLAMLPAVKAAAVIKPAQTFATAVVQVVVLVHLVVQVAVAAVVAPVC